MTSHIFSRHILPRQHPDVEQRGAQAYGRELAEAYEWCQKYRASRKEAELHQAWDLYYHVFKRINKQLPSLTVLELQYVAPALVRAQARPPAAPRRPARRARAAGCSAKAFGMGGSGCIEQRCTNACGVQPGVQNICTGQP